MSSKKILWYKYSKEHGGYIFTSRERGELITKIWVAIRDSKTFGAFFKAIQASEAKRLKELMRSDDGVPNSNEPFDAMKLPGYADGDYPPWLAAEAGHHLPAHLLQNYTLKRDSFLNGPSWIVPSDNLTPLVSELRSLGYEVEERNDLLFHV